MDTRLIHSYLYNLGIQGVSALIKPQTFSLIVQKKKTESTILSHKLQTQNEHYVSLFCYPNYWPHWWHHNAALYAHVFPLQMLSISFPIYTSTLWCHTVSSQCVWHMYLPPVRGRRYMYTHSTERKAMELCTRIGIAWKVTVQSCIQRELLDDSRVGWNYQCSSQKFTSKWCIIGMKHPLLLKC